MPSRTILTCIWGKTTTSNENTCHQPAKGTVYEVKNNPSIKGLDEGLGSSTREDDEKAKSQWNSNQIGIKIPTSNVIPEEFVKATAKVNIGHRSILAMLENLVLNLNSLTIKF